MTNLSTALEEHKTQLHEDLVELQQELQNREDKDNLRIGNALKALSREIDNWESDARDSDDGDESTQQHLMERARELRSKLVKMRSE